LFDVDGTLVDSVDLHARAWQEALAHFGFEIAYDAVRRQIGKGGDQLLPVFVPQDVLERIGDSIEAYRGELFCRDYLPRVKPFPRVRDLFERIKRDDYRVALASSGKTDEVEHYKKLLGVDDLVDVQTSSDDAESSKPCPDIFEVALQRADVEPHRALVIGDTPYDAIAARRAGLRTAGVLCGGFPETDLRAEGCVQIYRDPADTLDRYYELQELVTPALQTRGFPYGPAPSRPA
jgi:phosphoglycolate phosphatase-like HAD superfamily hydrolase